jgi:amino acid transporter
MIESGTDWYDLSPALQSAFNAWTWAPSIGSLKIIADLPALCITAIITYLVYIGIRESRNAGNLMVIVKLSVIALVIIAGAFYVQPENWSPFAPNGMKGVLFGVSAVFFAYIGFDAISTTAEECVNPQRDLPRGMIYSLIICTVLYVLISLILTGMVDYRILGVGDPLAFVFKQVGVDWISGIVAGSAIFAMAGVLLVFQLGQPRIWMSMSRDGLLPKVFSRIHPKFKTPSFSTIVTGFVVAIPALFMNLTEVTDLTSIGTLFAFVLVCGGVLVLQQNPEIREQRKFKIPYLNGRYYIPAIFIVILAVVIIYFPESFHRFFSLSDPEQPAFSVWEVLQHKIPMILFMILSVGILILSISKQLSLIPVLGLISCFFLMTELHITNWFRFGIWLIVGLLIYFLYSYRKSHLNNRQ